MFNKLRLWILEQQVKTMIEQDIAEPIIEKKTPVKKAAVKKAPVKKAAPKKTAPKKK